MGSIEVEHYPFKTNEPEHIIENAVFVQMKKLVDEPIFELSDKESILQWLQKHFLKARFMFLDEEYLRTSGLKNANLFYHGKEHAVYQTTYDAITVTRAILSREDRLSSHLSADGVVAIVLAAMYHDAGFVYQKNLLMNFAGISPFHVEESKRAAMESLKHPLEPPYPLDTEKIRKFVLIGIHRTYFPYNQERKEEEKKLIDELLRADKKEAQIIGLAVQFADLGGQTARIDQNPHGLIRLRDEMNAWIPNLGTKAIGEDHELETKRREFIEFVVKKTVGKTGNAFFKTYDHIFAREWSRALAPSR